MKKLLFVLFAVILSGSIFAEPWFRANEIDPNKLPEASKNIIKKYMGGLSSVTSAMEWPDNYGVYFKDGSKLNFFRDGSLKEAENERNYVPKGLLNELPSNVSSYVKDRYHDWGIVEIEVKRSKIEVELEKDGYEAKLKFSGAGRLMQEKIKD